MTAGNLCPVPEAGKWNFKLAAHFNQADVGNAIFGPLVFEAEIAKLSRTVRDGPTSDFD